jgi:hypothetical protein
MRLHDDGVKLDAGYWIRDAGYKTLDAGYWFLVNAKKWNPTI